MHSYFLWIVLLLVLPGVRLLRLHHERETPVKDLTVNELIDRAIPIRSTYSSLKSLTEKGKKALSIGLSKTSEATKRVTTDVKGLKDNTEDVLLGDAAIGGNPWYLVDAVYKTFKGDEPPKA